MKTCVSVIWVFISITGYLAPTPAHAVSLSDKLSKQWTKYDAARAELLGRIGNTQIPAEKKAVSRQDWEAILALEGPYAFTPDDLNQLKRIQEARIAAARENAIHESLIDFKHLRALPPKDSQDAITQFCRKIPKGGMLHIHPTGTLKQDTVQALVTKNDPHLEITQLLTDTENQLYPDEVAWLKSLGDNQRFSMLSTKDQSHFLGFFFLPPGSHPFTRFDAAFSFVGIAVDTWNDYFTAFWDFGRRIAEEGVSYVEFTTSLRPETLLNYEIIAKKYEADFGITARFNASFFRLSSQQSLAKTLESVLTVQSPLLVGIDFLGNETDSPALEDGQLVYGTVLHSVATGKSQLHRTMHAGELGDPRNPRDALILGAERLGHGVKLESDPIALEYASTKKVPIEINLVSNIRLRAIGEIKKHPFLRYLRLGLPVSLSTDDEGILETDINHECEVAISNSDVTYAEMKQMALNGIETSFAEDNVKKRLISRALNQFERFEKEYLGPSQSH